MWCLDCDYELIKLADSRCPECGREFSRDDPNTFKTEEAIEETRSRGITTISAFTGAILGSLTSSFLPIDGIFLRASSGAVAGMIAGILGAVIAGMLWRQRQSNRDEEAAQEA